MDDVFEEKDGQLLYGEEGVEVGVVGSEHQEHRASCHR
jgi:hypothetical protein